MDIEDLWSGKLEGVVQAVFGRVRSERALEGPTHPMAIPLSEQLELDFGMPIEDEQG
jgi:hypothetical protein